jgi:hypothetical protein
MALKTSTATFEEFTALQAADSKEPGYRLFGGTTYGIRTETYRKQVVFVPSTGQLFVEENFH